MTQQQKHIVTIWIDFPAKAKSWTKYKRRLENQLSSSNTFWVNWLIYIVFDFGWKISLCGHSSHLKIYPTGKNNGAIPKRIIAHSWLLSSDFIAVFDVQIQVVHQVVYQVVYRFDKPFNIIPWGFNIIPWGQFHGQNLDMIRSLITNGVLLFPMNIAER